MVCEECIYECWDDSDYVVVKVVVGDLDYELVIVEFFFGIVVVLVYFCSFGCVFFVVVFVLLKFGD